MGRKKYKTDTEIVDQALSPIEDPYNLRPLITDAPMDGTLEERIKYAKEVFRPEINRCYHHSVADLILAGRFIKASERLIDQHKGENKWYADFIDEAGWSGNFVRVSKRLAEVVACYPEAIKLPSGMGLRRILYWSVDRVGELLDEIGAENLQDLTEQRLLDVYREKEEETRQEKKEREQRGRAQKLRRHREKRIAQGLPPEEEPLTSFELGRTSFKRGCADLCRALDLLTDKDRERIIEEELRVDCSLDYEKLMNHPGWPPAREIPFELADHLKGRLINK